MFTFSASDVRALIARGEADAQANGGYRNPHYGLSPGKDEKPGLWLVGDQGVYLMSNGKLPDGMRPMVRYAAECDPTANPDWWHYKHRYSAPTMASSFSMPPRCCGSSMPMPVSPNCASF